MRAIKQDKLLSSRADYCIYICCFLACFVPRYLATLKIHIGINISLFDIAVAVSWFLTTRQIRVTKRIENSYFIVWTLLIMASFWRASKLGVWLYYMLWVFMAVLFQQMLLKHYKPNTIDIAIRALTDALFGQILIGLYEVTAHRYLFEVGNVARRLYGHVAISMFYNLNDYATFIVTMLPFALLLTIQEKRILRKALYGFTSVFAIYFAFASESRAAFLAIALIVMYAAYALSKKSKLSKLIVIMLIVISLFLVVAIPYTRDAIVMRFRRGLIDPTGASDSTRINLIKNGLYFLYKTYGFGVGAGNLYEWLTFRSIYPIGHISFIHNWYVEILVTFGIPFFILYMYFHAKLFISLYRKSVRERRFFTNTTAVLFSFILFSIISISSSSNIYSEWVWMYLALLATYVLKSRSS